MVNNNTPIPHCEHSLLSPEVGVGEHMDLEGCTWSIRKGDLEGAPGVEGRYRFARVTSLLQNGSHLIRLYCQTIFRSESVALWTPTLGLWEEDSLGSRGRIPWALGRNSGQDRAPQGCDQSRLGPGFPFFLSFILFLLSFFILGVLHLAWLWMSHSPTTRVTSSKRKSNALARRQKEAEDFSEG